MSIGEYMSAAHKTDHRKSEMRSRLGGSFDSIQQLGVQNSHDVGITRNQAPRRLFTATLCTLPSIGVSAAMQRRASL